jgi:hypothetical protein
MTETPPPPGPSISDQLREAVRASGLSCFDLGYHRCRPQLDPSLISRFVRGKRTLTLRSAESLARALGLSLVRDREPVASMKRNGW